MEFKVGDRVIAHGNYTWNGAVGIVEKEGTVLLIKWDDGKTRGSNNMFHYSYLKLWSPLLELL